MNVKSVEKENGKAKVVVEIDKAEFEQALNKAYAKCRKDIMLPGFRKGKAPRKMVESMYGATVFYEDAVNEIFPDIYTKAIVEQELKAVGSPSVSNMDTPDEGGVVLTIETELYPEVTLGQYKGLEVPKREVKVEESEVDAEVNRMAERNARIETVDRAAANGDTVVIDFEGFVDDKPFQGGKAEDYSLTIGSGSFIPGFEDQLIGAKIGEEKEVNVTFPEEYHEASLKGKPAVFKCTVKEIKVKELPAADDEFAKDVSEFDTLAEYKDDIRSKLVEKKEAQAKREKQNKAVDKAVANAQMEIPDAMVTEQVRRMADDFAKRLQSQGLTVEQYMQFTGMTADKLLEQMRPEALKRIQNSLVLEAVAKAENIEIGDDKVKEEIEKMATAYKMEFDKVNELIGEAEREQMKADLAIQAAVELIADAAVEVEAKEEPKTEE